MTLIATVIIPTTGSDELKDAIDSVLRQTVTCKILVVCDGEEFREKVEGIMKLYKDKETVFDLYLPWNTGADGFNGHKIYALASQMIKSDYVLFLDQDNWFDDERHVELCINVIRNEGKQWSYSFRKIFDKNKNFICEDNCESLGNFCVLPCPLIDTNCYCLTRELAIRVSAAWHNKWIADRHIFQALKNIAPNYAGTLKHTVGYRLGGNENSVTADFFLEQNEIVLKYVFKGVLPWKS